MKIFFITNLYPSDKEPYKGSFVKNIYDEFSNLGGNVRLVKLESFGLSKWLKLVSFFSFYMKSFFVALFSKGEDVFYIHYASHSSIGVLLASFLRKLNIVTNVHGSDILPEINYGKYSSLINRTLSKLILSRSIVVVSPSDYFKNIIHDKYNVSFNSIFVSPSGGVNGNIFHPRNTFKGNDHIKFGYVGRIENAKGIFDLLSAYLRLLKSHQNVTLTIIGSGSRFNEVKKLSSSVESIEVLHGVSQDKLAEQYSIFDYLIFPSHHESLGLVPIEAMMCGTPVISSQIGATNQYIKEGLKALSFESGNQEQLLECMEKAIYLDRNTYNELSILSQEIASEFKSDKVIRKLLNFFKYKFNTLN